MVCFMIVGIFDTVKNILSYLPQDIDSLSSANVFLLKHLLQPCIMLMILQKNNM